MKVQVCQKIDNINAFTARKQLDTCTSLDESASVPNFTNYVCVKQGEGRSWESVTKLLM